MKYEDDINELLFNKTSDEGFDMTSSPAANAGNPLNKRKDDSVIYEITSLFDNKLDDNIHTEQKISELNECLEYYQDNDLGPLSSDDFLSKIDDYF